MHQTLKNLLYCFIARDNPAKDSVPNRTFHADFQQALKDDPEYQMNSSIDQFLLVCEKLIYKWQQIQFIYDFRNDKSVGLVKGRQEEQEQPAAQSGNNGHRGRRALQGLW